MRVSIFRTALVAALILSLVIVRPAMSGPQLLMVEEDGCMWCARWNAEIGTAYARTPEGRAAPLRRIDINARIPEGLELDSRPRITPTFILVRGGAELGRIEGYPGEDFFWPMLSSLLARADIPLEDGPAAPSPPYERGTHPAPRTN